MSKIQPWRKYHHLKIYIGYGEAGADLRERVRAAIKSSGMSARDFLLNALKIKFSDDKK